MNIPKWLQGLTLDKNSLLDELNLRKGELNVKENIPLMITDSNQACFAQMTGRRVQENLTMILDTVCKLKHLTFIAQEITRDRVECGPIAPRVIPGSSDGAPTSPSGLTADSGR